MQIQDAEQFLDFAIKKMDWSSQEQDVVMDVGCGPGDSCRKILLPALPGIRKMIGVDILEDMIEFAKKRNAHEKIEYHVADIEDRSTILKWTQQLSKVISINCFHWLEDQKKAFENLYHILKPGGEAAVHFVLATHFWKSYHLLLNNLKCRKYLENKRSHVPESHFKNYGAAFFRDMLQGVGFDVIICEEENRAHTYSSDDYFRDAIFTISALTSYIPDELKPEFKEDLFQAFLQYNDRSSSGKPVLYYKTLSLLIRKPHAQ